MQHITTHNGFRHQKLRVYQHALQFSQWVHLKLKELPKGHGDLRNQLIRASNSIAMNLAEGSQQQSLPMARNGAGLPALQNCLGIGG